MKLYEYKRYTEILKEVKMKYQIHKKQHAFLISWGWLDSWIKYVTSDGVHPGPIDNRALWYLILNNKSVVRKKDYYIIDQKIWEFLHGIYTGGPILHKDGRKETNSETVSVRSSLTSFDGTSVGNMNIETISQSDLGLPPIFEKLQSSKMTSDSTFKKSSFASNIILDKDNMLNELRKESLNVNQKHILRTEKSDLHKPIAEMPIEDDNDKVYESSQYDDSKLEVDDETYDQEGEEEEEEFEDESENTLSNWQFNIIGLRNPNNFWYMNVWLQALLSVGELVEYYLKIEPNDLLMLAKVSKKKENMSYLFSLFWHEALVEDREDAYNPLMLQNAVKKIFSTQMQDTHEFILYFFSKLQEQENKYRRAVAKSKGIRLWKEPDPSGEPNANSYWNKYKENNSSIIDKLFSGLLSTSVIRKWCSKMTKNYEPFIDLSLEIKQSSVSGCLKDYFSEEIMGIDAKYMCDDCKVATKAVIKKRIEKLPRHLIIHLKRFEYPSLNKDRSLISYKHTLDVSKVVERAKGDDPNDYIYNLFGMIIHKGKEMDRGHYISVFKRDDRWYEFDDDKVYEIQGKEHTKHVLDKEIYMLFYEQSSK